MATETLSRNQPSRPDIRILNSVEDGGYRVSGLSVIWDGGSGDPGVVWVRRGIALIPGRMGAVHRCAQAAPGRRSRRAKSQTDH